MMVMISQGRQLITGALKQTGRVLSGEVGEKAITPAVTNAAKQLLTTSTHQKAALATTAEAIKVAQPAATEAGQVAVKAATDVIEQRAGTIGNVTGVLAAKFHQGHVLGATTGVGAELLMPGSVGAAVDAVQSHLGPAAQYIGADTFVGKTFAKVAGGMDTARYAVRDHVTGPAFTKLADITQPAVATVGNTLRPLGQTIGDTLQPVSQGLTHAYQGTMQAIAETAAGQTGGALRAVPTEQLTKISETANQAINYGQQHGWGQRIGDAFNAASAALNGHAPESVTNALNGITAQVLTNDHAYNAINTATHAATNTDHSGWLQGATHMVKSWFGAA
jgi:hypothetical protein